MNKEQLQVPALGAASPMALCARQGPGASSPGRGNAGLAPELAGGLELALQEEEAFKNAKALVRQQVPQMLHSSSSGPGCRVPARSPSGFI